MIKAGTCVEHAKSLAECLIAADKRGHYSHGLSRLDKYVSDVCEGRTCPSGEPRIVRDSPATALVDGANLLGPVIGNFCMSLAIQKAKQVGVGVVTAFRGTHFGKICTQLEKEFMKCLNFYFINAYRHCWTLFIASFEREFDRNKHV